MELNDSLCNSNFLVNLCDMVSSWQPYLNARNFCHKDTKPRRCTKEILSKSDLAICELKALETVNPVWQSQILSHLKLTGKRPGYLINFNVPLIKDGIKRFIM